MYRYVEGLFPRCILFSSEENITTSGTLQKNLVQKYSIRFPNFGTEHSVILLTLLKAALLFYLFTYEK